MSHKISLYEEDISKLIDKFELEKEQQKKQEETLQGTIERYQKELESVRKIKERFDFVSKILSVQPTNSQLLNDFHKAYDRFINFANKEESLAEEAKAIHKMDHVRSSIEHILTFPEVFTKNIIAIGGGFSSGKSALINSFFKEKKIQLPVGIRPVTAIATYVTSGEKNCIKGYSKKGGALELDASLFEKLSHDFLDGFEFNIKEILPHVSVEVPMLTGENICFIDTPGYNPAATSESKRKDLEVSKHYIEKANVVIWMIGLDAIGTISKSDIEYLQSMDLSQKKLFVVANKAELKPLSELEEILNEIKEELEDFDIKYAGISAYSASRKKEFSFIKNSFIKFLETENVQQSQKFSIIEQIEEVIMWYYQAISRDKTKITELGKLFHQLELDLLEVQDYSSNLAIKNRLTSISKAIDRRANEKKYSEHLEELIKIKDEMGYVVGKIFKSETKSKSESRSNNDEDRKSFYGKIFNAIDHSKMK